MGFGFDVVDEGEIFTLLTFVVILNVGDVIFALILPIVDGVFAVVVVLTMWGTLGLVVVVDGAFGVVVDSLVIILTFSAFTDA